MLPGVFPVIDQRWLQNIAQKTKRSTRDAAECVTDVLTTSDLFGDLLLYKPEQHRIYLFYMIKNNKNIQST